MTAPELQFRAPDRAVWSTATWAAPFVVQIVLCVLIAACWTAGKLLTDTHGLLQFAIGTAVTLLLMAAVVGALFTSQSPRARGVAVSIVGSFVVTLVGGLCYGLWIIGW
ncbi:hypothetical protein ACFQWH_09465 [Mycolicibacterium sp. GCM10028919]|uniref:hypothetical protein n=1 Tax=Mycolicibacterium sp. GCM10028919 TaxID=3273401 RepID=UPI00361259B6